MYSDIEEQELNTDQEFRNNQVVDIVTLDSIDHSDLGTIGIPKAVQWLKDQLTNYEKGHIKNHFFSGLITRSKEKPNEAHDVRYTMIQAS